MKNTEILKIMVNPQQEKGKKGIYQINLIEKGLNLISNKAEIKRNNCEYASYQ
jgi:hypothetical protein